MSHGRRLEDRLQAMHGTDTARSGPGRLHDMHGTDRAQSGNGAPRAGDGDAIPDDLGADDLDKPVDWMTYSHRKLHHMVHQNLDVSSASSVAGDWEHLATQLEEITEDLRRAVQATTDGWDGDGAEAARKTVHKLVQWTERTNDSVKQAANCVSRQVEIVRHARNAMPEPPADGGGWPLPEHAEPIPMTPGMLRGTSGADFASARSLSVDTGQQVTDNRAIHRHAADIMAEMQAESAKVYRDVPRFRRPPVPRYGTNEPSVRPQEAEPPAGPGLAAETDTTTSAASAGLPGSASTSAGAATGGTSGVPGGIAGGGAGAIGGHGVGTRGEGLVAGARSGAALDTGTRPAAASTATSAAGGSARGGAYGPMGMPMGAAAGRQGQTTEHRTASYLEDDSGLFSIEGKVMPPVLGVDPPAREQSET